MPEPGAEAVVSRRRKGRARSPFLMERTAQTVPQTSPSLYTRDLFERSNKAVEQVGS